MAGCCTCMRGLSYIFSDKPAARRALGLYISEAISSPGKVTPTPPSQEIMYTEGCMGYVDAGSTRWFGCEVKRC